MLTAQNPHGDNFAMDCAKCHSPENWLFSAQTSTFSHDSTSFPLTGQHKDLDCRSCHTSPVFKEAETNCISCHTDVHQMTVGNDCARCHTPVSWIVENVTEMHEKVSFPLMGVHSTVNCNQCHVSETNVRFGPTGVTCIDCHRADYETTKKPDHIKLNFDTDCAACHSLTGTEWNTEAIDHNFFPLERGHMINDCSRCHNPEDYSAVQKDCYGCHQSNFEATTLPNHRISGFSNDCASCHTIDPGWQPVNYPAHDGSHFPIYSGKHKGVWKECTECHTNPNNYTTNSCVVCHKNPDTDQVHISVSGYHYDDGACLACHPTGDGDMAFDHNMTAFPLTGAHRTTDCAKCHINGYTGTSTVCVDCHQTNFNQASNPSHTDLGLNTDCATCHTTEPGWSPARFDIHNNYYALNGAHAAISQQCATCHNGDYNNTPNTCYGCHKGDYDQVQEPDHKGNNLSTDCTSCHSETAWLPSTFNHDGLYFPVFSGKHKGVWNQCSECHTTQGDLTKFSCTVCHLNPETNNAHQAVAGYAYNDQACFACHPTGDADMAFNHNSTSFPLTGAHTSVECLQCHANGFQGTPTACVSCHIQDHQQSINPPHSSLGIGTDCVQCHSTDPGWTPAKFPEHNTYYALNGAHALIAENCASCHNGNYTNTPNTCYGCHSQDYTSAQDPNHIQLQFPVECTQCHTEGAWKPSTFDHDGMYFPVYSGKHKGVWNECMECHNTPGQWNLFTCITCHQNPETNNQHTGVQGYTYQNPACLACHPTGEADVIFDHNMTMFPLTGAHTTVNCLECHAAGFQGTNTTCVGCHTQDFNQAANPNHQNLQIPSDCVMCHTTAPGWSPATFPLHNDFYALNGAHAAISNNCAACHNGNYVNTPNTCAGCHISDYNGTTDPNHQVVQFPTDCASCHGESVWVPATFNHDGQYFPIYSGKHKNEWTQCLDCHIDPNNYAVFTCTTCHQNPQTNEEHDGVSGYVYSSPACLACHPTGEADVIFDHNTTGFVLTGAHNGLTCLECHSSGFQGTPNDCAACHIEDFNQSVNPNHPSLGLSTDCNSCHTTAPGWSPATFANHNDYYVITGAHTAISNNCAACHNGNYNNTPNTCFGCHSTDFNGTTNPDHEAGMFPTDCTTCHSQDAWSPSSFDHAIFWPLTGAHNAVAGNCAACHNGNYNNTPSECVACHQTDFDGSINPDHDAIGIGTDCASCHTTAPGWSPATFANHNDYYVITGAHTAIANNCAACHNGNYVNTPNTCYGCHQSDFNATVNPDHESGGYPTDCTVCHTQDAWMPSVFDHNTVYPLTGAHAQIANNCVVCHNGNYNNTPNTCAGCHQDDFNNSMDPDHETLAFSNDCMTCHTTNPGWMPASMPTHNQYYVIAGAHLAIANNCAACHMGSYNNTPNTCYGCHTTDYNTATDPNHLSNQLPTDCTSCHSQNAWSPSTFNHNNIYPLTGAHASIVNNCAVCHNGNFNNTPNTCAGCHLPDYNTSVNPNHISLGIPTDCATCHSTNPDWMPALFPIHNNYYVLAGAHVGLDCVQCHNGNYNNTPNTCAGCHISDYNAATDPNHLAAQFPTNCASCHSQNAWVPSTFDHDNMYFPIFSGKHDNEWNLCSECHTNASNYNIFNCLLCHEHNNPVEMAGHHNGVSGYSYNSNACYSCHPNGEAD